MVKFIRKNDRKKLLQVGDGYFIPAAFSMFFENHGYDIVSVTCETAELPAVVRLQPEIIVIDFDMHCNDAYLVASILHEALPESFIAMMNGHNHHCDEYEANLAGVRKILSRQGDPVEYDELLHTLEKNSLEFQP